MYKRLLLIFTILLSLIYSGYALTNINDCSGSTYIANTPGETYQLTTDLTTTGSCINILADDITLDCQGYNITGDFSFDNYAINSTGDNVIIKNCKPYYFDRLLVLQNSVNVSVLNNYFLDSNDADIKLYSVNNSRIINNTFNNPSDTGSTMEYNGETSNNILFENNTIIHTNYDGIYIGDDNNNWTIRGNYFFNTSYSVYAGTNWLIEENVFNYSQDEFIYESKPGTIIRNNVFINNYNTQGAFHHYSGDEFIIEDNTFIDISVIFNDVNDVVINFKGTNTLTNVDYVIYDTTDATWIIDEDSILPAGNYFLNDTDLDGAIIINNSGITLDCNGANIIGSYITGGEFGLNISNQDDVIIENCNIYGYGNDQNKIYNSNNLIIRDSYFVPSYRKYFIDLSYSNNFLIDNITLDGRPHLPLLGTRGVGGGDIGYSYGTIQNSNMFNMDYDYFMFAHSPNVTVKNNYFNSTSWTLGFNNISNALVENNIFQYTTDDGSWLDYAYLSNITLKDNIYRNNFGSSTKIFAANSGGAIYNLINNQFSNMNTLFDDSNFLFGVSTGNTVSNVSYIIYDTWEATVWINNDVTLPRGNYILYDTDLNGAFRINASNIVFDCNGANITGNGVGYGIQIESGVDNITIKNCNIHNYVNGLYILDIGYPNPNLFYNNLFNVSGEYINEDGTTNFLNNTVGGNYYANSSGTGFSQTCVDADINGICDSSFTVDVNNVDYLPLALLPTFSESSTPAVSTDIDYIYPNPPNNGKVTGDTIYVNVTYAGESVSNCQINYINGSTYSMTDGSTYCYIQVSIDNTQIQSIQYNVTYDLSSTTYSLDNRIFTYYPQLNNQSSNIFPSINTLGVIISIITILLLI